jgi:ABC-type Fe3+/spermidine/putrescine transport system ATPase subunit
VLLLDEPLSALDLAIRLEMEEELRRLHREIGATFLYVTHDQREALALSNRVVVFNHGRIEQVDRPERIYQAPKTPFVARFVGDANVMPARVIARTGDQVEIALGDARFFGGFPEMPDVGLHWLVLRPEALMVQTEGVSSGSGVAGIVQDFAYRGSGYSYRIAVPGVTELLKAETRASSAGPVAIGSRVHVTWEPSACLFLKHSESQ